MDIMNMVLNIIMRGCVCVYRKRIKFITVNGLDGRFLVSLADKTTFLANYTYTHYNAEYTGKTHVNDTRFEDLC